MSNFPVLTKDEEIELALQYRAGREAQAELEASEVAGKRLTPAKRIALKKLVANGLEARDRFVSCNLRLVIAAVQKKKITGDFRNDLCQEGAMGVVTAVEKFDPDKGFKFSTYATWWINQAISRAMQKHLRTIALPEDVDAEVRRLRYFREEFYAENYRDPTTAELAEQMNLSVAQVRKLRQWGEPTASLDDVYAGEDGDGRSRGDTYVDSTKGDFFEPLFERFEADAIAAELQVTATPEETRVIVEALGLADGVPKSVAEISKCTGLTRSQTRTKHHQGLTKARNTPTARAGRSR